MQHEWGYWSHVGLITEKFVGVTVNENPITLQCYFINKNNDIFPQGGMEGSLSSSSSHVKTEVLELEGVRSTAAALRMHMCMHMHTWFM